MIPEIVDLPNREARAVGHLWGVALGDALGLYAENLSQPRAARLAARLRYRLWGHHGFVSDDTEQSALVAQALIVGREDDAVCRRRFRRALLGWFARLPFGVGLATVRACVRLAVGLEASGVSSAGNGAAMRSGVLGVALADEPERRRRLTASLAQVTHTDPRAIEAAQYVAEVAAACTHAAPEADRRALVEAARGVITSAELARAVDTALTLEASTAEAARTLGTTGFVVHTVGFATWCFVTQGAVPLEAIRTAIAGGGDTDTIAAIVGGWVGALHGAAALPQDLVAAIDDGPFGPTHLRALGVALAQPHERVAPPWSAVRALVRNLLLMPLIIGHAILRPLTAR